MEAEELLVELEEKHELALRRHEDEVNKNRPKLATHFENVKRTSQRLQEEFKQEQEELVAKFAFKASDVKKKLDKLTKDQDRKSKKTQQAHRYHEEAVSRKRTEQERSAGRELNETLQRKEQAKEEMIRTSVQLRHHTMILEKKELARLKLLDHQEKVAREKVFRDLANRQRLAKMESRAVKLSAMKEEQEKLSRKNKETGEQIMGSLQGLKNRSSPASETKKGERSVRTPRDS